MKYMCVYYGLVEYGLLVSELSYNTKEQTDLVEGHVKCL